MKRIVLALMLTCVATGCGNSGGSAALTYRLKPSTMQGGVLNGSLLTISSTLGGFPPMQESLIGSFVATPQSRQSPDDLFRFVLSQIHLQSQSYRIDGTGGEMFASAVEPRQITMTLNATIDGQPVTFHGDNASDTFSGNPPTLMNVSLTNEGGYFLQLFAAPEN